MEKLQLEVWQAVVLKLQLHNHLIEEAIFKTIRNNVVKVTVCYYLVRYNEID